MENKNRVSTKSKRNSFLEYEILNFNAQKRNQQLLDKNFRLYYNVFIRLKVETQPNLEF